MSMGRRLAGLGALAILTLGLDCAMAQDMRFAASGSVLAEGFTSGGARLKGGAANSCSSIPCAISIPAGSAIIEPQNPTFDGAAEASIGEGSIRIAGSVRTIGGSRYVNAGYSAGGSQRVYARVPLDAELRVTLTGTGEEHPDPERPSVSRVLEQRQGSARTRNFASDHGLGSFTQTYTVRAGPDSIQVNGQTYYFVDEIFASATAGASAETVWQVKASFAASVSIEVKVVGKVMRRASADGQPARLNEPVTPPFKVIVVQADTGEALVNIPVTFAVEPTSPPGGYLSDYDTQTAPDDRLASTRLTVGPAPGTYRVRATCGGCLAGYDTVVFSAKAFKGIRKTLPWDEPIPEQSVCGVQIYPLGRLLSCPGSPLDLECRGTRDESGPACSWTAPAPAEVVSNPGRKALFTSPVSGDFPVRVDYSVPFAGCHTYRTVRVRGVVVEGIVSFPSSKGWNFLAGETARLTITFSGAGDVDSTSLVKLLPKDPESAGYIEVAPNTLIRTSSTFSFEVRFTRDVPWYGITYEAKACGSSQPISFIGARAP